MMPYDLHAFSASGNRSTFSPCVGGCACTYDAMQRQVTPANRSCPTTHESVSAVAVGVGGDLSPLQAVSRNATPRAIRGLTTQEYTTW